MLWDALDTILFFSDFSRRARASLMLELMAILSVFIGLVIRNDSSAGAAILGIGLLCWAPVAVGYSILLWWAGVTSQRRVWGVGVFVVGIALTVAAILVVGPEATAGFEFALDRLWAYGGANLVFGFFGAFVLAIAPVEDTG